MIKNRVSIYLFAFLMIGYFLLALPENGVAQPPTPEPLASVPTLDVWGIIVMTLILAVFAVLAIRRSRAKT